MTDTPKTLADVLRCAVRPPHMLSPSAENAYLGAANMAEQHEARWSAERAELQLRADVLRQRVEELSAEIEEHEKELEAFRALAKKAHDMNQRSAIGVYEVTGVFHELVALAPKENATPYDADSTQVS